MRCGTGFDGIGRMRFLLLCLAFGLSGCTVSPTPLEPQQSGASESVTSEVGVTVRVLTYQTEHPIGGATILRDAAAIGLTGQDGVFVFQVKPGTAIVLAVTKPGYVPSIAAEGEINGANERWTYYLEPLATVEPLSLDQ